MPQPGGGHALADAMLALAERSADRIQRWKQTGDQGRRIIPQVEVFDAAGHKAGVRQEFQHRVLRVVDDVTRDIQSIPLRAECFELPAIDVRYLEHESTIRL